MPDVLDRSIIDEIVTVGNQTAFDNSRLLARTRAFWRDLIRGGDRRCAGVGSRAENAGKNIVVIIPSFAERYISSLLFRRALSQTLAAPLLLAGEEQQALWRLKNCVPLHDARASACRL